MYIPGPSFSPVLVFHKLDEFLKEFEDLPKITGGVAIYGSAAAYGLVWELGSRRLKEPGPKTMWSVNRKGERAILTQQAPYGYIGIHEDDFWPILVEELSTLTYNAKSAHEMQLKLSVVLDNANQRIARLISDSAPVDSGDLRTQIQYVESSFSLEDMSDAESNGTLVF